MPDYTGPERRQERLNLSEAMIDVRNLQAAVVDLANAASHMVPREEIEEKFMERRQIVFTAVSLLVVFAGLGLALIVLLAELDGNAKEARLGTLCLIEQLAEHREQTTAHISDTAEALGRPAPPTGNEPPPVPRELKRACQAFFPPYPPGPVEVTR